MKKRRIEYIRPYVKNKKVLDLGIVQHSIESVAQPLWLHDQIREEAAHCLGVDLLHDEIDELKGRGYNVVCADVETMELGERFDTVVAGEIIEHLANPGLFLQTVHKHLRPGGTLLLTTPNPFNLGCFIKPIRLLLGKDTKVHPQHVCWYGQRTLRNLLERYGFETKESFTFPADRHGSFYRLVFSLPTLGTKIFVAARKKELELHERS